LTIHVHIKVAKQQLQNTERIDTRVLQAAGERNAARIEQRGNSAAPAVDRSFIPSVRSSDR
jgi:hypothetical protein